MDRGTTRWTLLEMTSGASFRMATSPSLRSSFRHAGCNAQYGVHTDTEHIYDKLSRKNKLPPRILSLLTLDGNPILSASQGAFISTGLIMDRYRILQGHGAPDRVHFNLVSLLGCYANSTTSCSVTVA
ncbi:hypothetical protein VTN96DRAFT_4813 [Rasamsonia emersonii]